MTSSARQEAAGVALLSLGALALVAGLGYQTYLYLKHGVWFGLSVIEALHWIGVIKDSWYTYPQDWIGVHKVLSFLNAGFSTLVLCWIVGIAVLSDP